MSADLFAADTAGKVETVKALSLWQPWASLWACGRKRYETRSWDTLYRGPLLIHAARRCTTDVTLDLETILQKQFGVYWEAALPRGALLARAELVKCWRVEDLTPDRDERAQGNFGAQRYAWEIAHIRPLRAPIPWRGRQGLFEVPVQAIEKGLP